MSFFGSITSPLLDETSAPVVRRALQRARVVGSFAFAQAAVQLIGFGSGILLVRQLSEGEYAYFTIANTMQATINVLADVGISIGVVSIGGRVWRDRHRFGQLIATALRMRRMLGASAALIVTPILYFMLLKNGASISYATVLVAIVLGGLAAQLAVGVLSVVPRLHSDIDRIRTIDLTGAISRLVVLLGLVFVFLNAGVALAVSAAAIFLQYMMLRRYVRGVIDFDVAPNEEDRHAIRGFVRSQAANSIFFCLQGQITVFLISLFGARASSVAEVGALGRLAMIFAVISNLLTNVFAPAFARCQSPRRLRWQYAGVVGAVAGFSAVILTTAWLFPSAFLYVLGSKYSHLERELVLMVGGAVASAFINTLWALNSSKAWIRGSWLYIPLTLGTQLALIPFTDFSSVRGVLIFNLISAAPNLLLNIALSYRGFRAAHLAAVAA
ncbi:MAG: polysaccharide biosynthesis protein [Verrucomicrobiota bacterium]|nr:polysaccharide biosynthesis protein [Verrucomicrobiota bacterium]